MELALGIVYAIGVAVGLIMTDASWPARIALSVLWPIGPLAFVGVILTLVTVLALAVPWIGGGLLIAALAAAYFWR